MTQKRPINADTPAAVPKGDPEPAAAPVVTPPTEEEPPKAPKSERKRVPTALKGIAGLVIVALVFVVAAILGGGGANDDESAAGSGESAGAVETSPTAASNNTTRIEGADTAGLASNIAFTVFPSKTPAQRPESVTLVGEDNWQNAVAAAVFMAEPLRAPLLISSADGMPEVTKRAVETLQPHGNRLKQRGFATTKGVPFYVIGAIATPTGGRTNKTGETAGAVQAKSIQAFRKTLFREAPRRVIIAPENAPEFAAPAAAWAARSGDPVLYTREDELPKATVEALERFPVTAYVLGPPSVISPAVAEELDKLATNVKRIAGRTPAENAVAFARYSDGGFGWNINDPGHGFVIVRSDEPLNAALAAPLSASGTWGPLLLTESTDKLPKTVREYLLDVKPGYTTDPTRAFYNHVWIIGDEGEIDATQQAEINQLAELTKVGGGP